MRQSELRLYAGGTAPEQGIDLERGRQEPASFNSFEARYGREEKE